jgi:hypothetical protein
VKRGDVVVTVLLAHELDLVEAVQAWSAREYELTGQPPKALTIATSAGPVEVRAVPRPNRPPMRECQGCGAMVPYNVCCQHQGRWR